MTVEDQFQNTLYDKLVSEPFQYNEEFEQIPRISRDLFRLVLPITFHFDMNTKNNRDEIHRSVYVAQRFWKDLNFRFGFSSHNTVWCNRLFEDLSESYAFYIENDAHKIMSYVICNMRKIDVVKSQIVRNFMSSPIEFDKHNWLNVLVSLHYLIKVCEHSIDSAKSVMKDSGQLYIEKAISRIEEFERYDMDRI